jgi:hypothetical protein
MDGKVMMASGTSRMMMEGEAILGIFSQQDSRSQSDIRAQDLQKDSFGEAQP